MRVPTKFISVCLVAALIVAACSSGDSDSETTTTVSPPTTTASPPTTSTSATVQSTTTTEAAVPSSTTTTSAPATTTTTSTTTSTVPQPIPAAQVRVKVFNGSGVAGAAGRLTARISESGYGRLTPANAPRSYSSSVIYYASSEYSANARQLLDDVDLASATIAGLLPDPSPVDSGQANLIVIIGRDELADSLRAPAAEQNAENPDASSNGERTTPSSTTTTTTTTTTVARSNILFPTATTVVPETSPEVTAPPPTQAPSSGSDGGPPAIPSINFGDLDALETPNISVVVRDGADEGGRLRYQVRRGSELSIEVISSVGNGAVRVEGYGISERTTLFAGAWISFTANRSGVFDISFTPDSTGEEEVIFQIEVS